MSVVENKSQRQGRSSDETAREWSAEEERVRRFAVKRNVPLGTARRIVKGLPVGNIPVKSTG